MRGERAENLPTNETTGTRHLTLVSIDVDFADSRSHGSGADGDFKIALMTNVIISLVPFEFSLRSLRPLRLILSEQTFNRRGRRGTQRRGGREEGADGNNGAMDFSE